MNTEIIAEIGWNHMGDPSLASEMIQAAAAAGASTVKFQYWDPRLLGPGDWDTDGRREIYNKAALTPQKIQDLVALAEKYSVKFLISAFGTNGAKLIDDLGIEDIKIPSHEIANSGLLEFCASNFKKIYLSAGAASSSEVLNAVGIMKSARADFVLMHCVSSYPCPENKANLPRLKWLSSLWPEIGLSDHTSGIISPAVAVALGAKVVEKHFTTDKDLPGRDNKFAVDPAEFASMIAAIVEAEETMTDHGIEAQDIEADTMTKYRGRWEPADYLQQ